MNSLRRRKIEIILLGLGSAFCFGIPAAALAMGLAASVTTIVDAKIAQMQEEKQLKTRAPTSC